MHPTSRSGGIAHLRWSGGKEGEKEGRTEVKVLQRSTGVDEASPAFKMQSPFVIKKLPSMLEIPEETWAQVPATPRFQSVDMSHEPVPLIELLPSTQHSQSLYSTMPMPGRESLRSSTTSFRLSTIIDAGQQLLRLSETTRLG